MDLLDGLFSSPACTAAFAPRASLQAMLDVEAALARAQARLGLVPAAAADAITRACDAAAFDAADLAARAALAGNLAIPLVQALTARVAAIDGAAARHVHWGATSQDIIDTALVLQLRQVLPSVEADLARLCNALAMQARRHRDTVLAGRTWMQQAAPTTLGLKFAGALDACTRHARLLAQARADALVIQLGGAVGNLSAYGSRGPELAAAFATELDLGLPDLPWHGHRDRLATLGSRLCLLVGTLGKLARDLSLLMQTEVAEAAEPHRPGRGASSAMPHKRNPVACAVVLAAAARTPGLLATLAGSMVQEHERALGGWQAEWETLPQVLRLACGALAQLAPVLEDLEVDPARMRANLDAGGGLALAEAVALALAASLGKAAAHQRVERACDHARQHGGTLREALARDPEVLQHLDAARLDALCDAAAHVGSAGALVDAVLARHDSCAATGAG